MKKSLKRMALWLCMCLICSAASALASSFPIPEPITSDPIKLIIGLPLSATVTDFDTNYMTSELKRLGNYEFEFVFFADEKEMAQKISMMVMNNVSDLPDVIMTGGRFSIAQLVQWAEAGAILPLNDYYYSATHYIDEAMQNTGMSKADALKYITAPDGNIYGMYRLNQSLLNENEERMFIYKPWLDKLGLEVPTNLDEFYQVLVAFRDCDPNGNGLRDEIPMMLDNSSLGFARRTMANFLMTGFVYTNYASNSYFTVDEKGVLRAAYASDGWREGLRYLNRLMSEGLFSDLSLSIDQSQLKVLMSETETKVGVCSGTVSNYLGATDPRRTEYYVLPALAGSAGRHTSVNLSMPEVCMVITSACEHPEAAFRLGDLMCSSYFSVMTRWGQEGIDWLTPAENEESLFAAMGYKALLKAVSAWGVEQNQWWAQMGPFIRDYSYGVGMVAADNPYDTQRTIAQTLGEYIALTDRSLAIGALVYSEQEQEIVNEYENALLNYAKESFSLFMNGDMSLENDWDAYLETLSNMGLDELTAAKQTAYNRMNAQ